MSEKLTSQQIENWRKILFGMIGLYALMMPVEEIQKFRDKMQANVDKCEAEKEEK